MSEMAAGAAAIPSTYLQAAHLHVATFSFAHVRFAQLRFDNEGKGGRQNTLGVGGIVIITIIINYYNNPNHPNNPTPTPHPRGQGGWPRPIRPKGLRA